MKYEKLLSEEGNLEVLSGADMLMRALYDAGVEVIFGYPGGSALHIYDALHRQQYIKHVLVRHEQAATHAADAYSRSTHKVGVVLVTSGPGATNAITGIATAYMDSIPMVVVSAQVASDKIGEDAFQETDMVGISRSVTKHSFLVKDVKKIPEIVRKAFHIATTGRPGPVVIDLPKDITAPEMRHLYSYPTKLSLRSYDAPQKGEAGQIKKAVQLLRNAKRPVLYAGGGVVQGEACDELARLAELLNAPVTNTLMGLGAFPGTHSQFLGMLGMHGTVEANLAMHNADVILAVGARFDDRVTNTPDRFCPGAKIIHIDIDAASISKTIEADIPIIGPAKSILYEMAKLMVGCDVSEKCLLADWWETIGGWRREYGLKSYQKPDTLPSAILPQEVIGVLFEITRGDAYITTDVGQHQMFSALYYPFDKPKRWISSGGLGTMGFGLPAALGVQYAHPEATVVCITGEGSIQMCIQELSTCSQYKLPVKIICLNNKALGMVKQWQDIHHGGRYSQILYEDSLPDFVKLAEAYGHVGIKITSREHLKEKLTEAFALTDRVVFVDIDVCPHEHVYPMHVALGAMCDMWIGKGERI